MENKQYADCSYGSTTVCVGVEVQYRQKGQTKLTNTLYYNIPERYVTVTLTTK